VRAAAHAVRGLKSRPEEFCLMQDYVEDFSNKICSVDKVTQRIIKEQRGRDQDPTGATRENVALMSPGGAAPPHNILS